MGKVDASEFGGAAARGEEMALGRRESGRGGTRGRERDGTGAQAGAEEVRILAWRRGWLGEGGGLVIMAVPFIWRSLLTMEHTMSAR